MSEHKLTEEVRKKLLNRIPFSRSSCIDYTPRAYLTKELDSEGKETDEYEIPEEYRPIFTMRPLTNADKTLLDKAKDSNKEEVLNECLRKNIIGMQKFYDAGTMEEIPYKPDADGGMSKELYETIPFIIKTQLYNFLIQISGMSATERVGF